MAPEMGNVHTKRAVHHSVPLGGIYRIKGAASGGTGEQHQKLPFQYKVIHK